MMCSHCASRFPIPVILLLGTSILSSFGQNSTDSEIQQRIIYVTPEDSCPVDHYYCLEDVLSNSSYFFDSYTTLEVLPGVYNITEKVGQLVLVEVVNFTLRGSSPNVTIICQPGATWGLTSIKSLWVEISNIQIYNCSANLQLEGYNNTILTAYNELVGRYIEYDLSSCDVNVSKGHPACHAYLSIFENIKVTIHQTAIFYSRGVGIFSINNKGLEISKTVLAHNRINCIHYIKWFDTTNTILNISHSQINFGQLKPHSFEFASGLNLFVHLNEHTHNISLTNITLANNRGTHGNFYMTVQCLSMMTDANILINNISSIQTDTIASPGIIIKYNIRLFTRKRTRRTFDFSHDQHGSRTEHVHIVLQNGYFKGSCVMIRDSFLLIESTWYRFDMNNIVINESRCEAALSVIDSQIYDSLSLSNLTIINSHNNILSVNLNGIEESKVMLTGKTYFLSNKGSISLLSGIIEFQDFVLISGNIAQEYESVFQVSDSSKVYFEGEIMFINNSGRQGGAISAYNSQLYFEGNMSFIGNSAVESGGAISLKEGAVINLKNNTHVMFIGNVADTYGGAIYVEDSAFWIKRRMKCFLIVDSKKGYYNVRFENNTAGKAGADLFGGWIDLCETKYGIERPSDILDFKTDNSVGSNPTRVCMCTNSTLNKHKAEAHISVFPGQTFEIEAVAVGQRFGMIPASIRAESDVINQLQNVQDTENQCTKLKFTVQSSNRNETILLSIHGQIWPKWINESINIPAEFVQFKVLIILLECPLGFEFDDAQNICSCQTYLNTYGVQCNYTTYTVNRRAQQWIGILDHTRIIVHQHCPYDYCNPHALSLNLSVPDEQCSSYRSGILCGECQPGFSQVLGTSNCKKCSNAWILLTLIFASAGVLLVAGLVLFNLTVSMGTINGIIFYANIVRANTATFFPDKTANTFLSWFIAWLNLDVGIETCFYDGLNAYMKTWLQFVFPLYIWFLVAMIIISSKYSKRAANTFGVNAVQILATLFLLSYAKLLRVTIMVFQSTHLRDNNVIWYYDGNVTYLGKFHAPLMLVALILFALFLLPYTLTIFGIQWLQKFSHYKPFVWVNKLKPLFDAYTGPYKDKHRYWTGLLLLVRIGLFIVFSTNTSGDPAINLLAIIVVVMCLFAYLAIFGGIYKNWALNILEYSSLLNLATLSVAILYTISVADNPNHTLSQVSVSITLCTTMLIVAYHGLMTILKALKLDKKMWRSNKTDKQLSEIADEHHDVMLNPQVTHSVIELKEPLLEC